MSKGILPKKGQLRNDRLWKRRSSVVFGVAFFFASALWANEIEILMQTADYAEARLLIHSQLQTTSDPKEKGNLYWLLAICWLSENSEDKAQQSLRSLLSEQPDFTPPVNSSPKLLKAFLTVKDEIKIKPTINLPLIQSQPEFTKRKFPSWPLWVSISAVALGGLIYGTVALLAPEQGALRVVVR